ncbi:MAG: ATP-dependent DNA helicase RecG, partial [Actinomycetota bacterium]
APPHLKVALQAIGGVTAKQAEVLSGSRLAITSVQDLILHFPRRHLDFSDTKQINQLRVGDDVTVIGEVKRVSAPPPRRPKVPVKVAVYDGSSYLWLTFFNQPWRAKQLRPGTLIAARGKISLFRGDRQMNSPLVDVIKDSEEVVKVVPVYPATAEIHTAWLRRLIRSALEQFEVSDTLAPALLDARALIGRDQAVNSFHFPEDLGQRAVARKRLVFDELFTLQLGLAYRKHRIERDTLGIAHETAPGPADQFLGALPFTLTGAQRRAIDEIKADMARPIPMHRLLQGEVGSGKTVVAIYAALLAAQGGYQTAIMAPTEVLANQHYLSVNNLLEAMGSPKAGPDGPVASLTTGQMGLFGGSARAVLLTGSTPAAQRKQALASIADGSADIVIGTHALIQEGVQFARLGLAIIDEQHRFGVRQRLALKEKTGSEAAPDVLIMTATPIPRTLAFTLYGDLDVSVLDELPKGRPPITTQVIDEAGRQKAYDLVREEVARGRQAYVITPLVEESEKVEVKAAEAEASRLATEIFPELNVGMIHGRMRPPAKQKVMDEFRRGRVDVLISTTVVEVGVDVPNASVMLIEDADRFGLSQLHQLRGRIGRGAHKSTCLLLTSFPSDDGDEATDAHRRLEVMASTTDGFELATKDLELRGTGTILGDRQSGFSDLRLTHLVRDIEILKAAREEAFRLIAQDPDLSRHPHIRLEMEGRFADRLDWLFRS